MWKAIINSHESSSGRRETAKQTDRDGSACDSQCSRSTSVLMHICHRPARSAHRLLALSVEASIFRRRYRARSERFESGHPEEVRLRSRIHILAN